MIRAKRAKLVALVVAVLITATGTAWGATTEEKCEAAKNREAGKYAFCRAKAEAKSIKKGEAPDYSKCDTKLLKQWAKAEEKAVNKGTACIDAVSDAAIQSFVTAHTDVVASALAGGTLLADVETCNSDLAMCNAALGTCPTDLAACEAEPKGQRVRTGQTQCWNSSNVLTPCAGTGQDGDTLTGLTVSFTDNGDGTITDNHTGLMWEKLSSDGSIHDWAATYTWHNAGTKITALNGGGGFAGYTDWRLPNINELQSLANYGTSAPAVHAPFHTGCVAACTVTTCSCTQSSNYWSSTTRLVSPTNAWLVLFNEGGVSSTFKTSLNFVRAVRGGS